MKVTPEMTVDAIARVLAQTVARNEALGPGRPAEYAQFDDGFRFAVERVAQAVSVLLPPGETTLMWTTRITHTKSQDV